jgi:hypothetical protein
MINITLVDTMETGGTKPSTSSAAQEGFNFYNKSDPRMNR